MDIEMDIEYVTIHLDITRILLQALETNYLQASPNSVATSSAKAALANKDGNAYAFLVSYEKIAAMVSAVYDRTEEAIDMLTQIRRQTPPEGAIVDVYVR